ncbi:MAG TPA: DUF1501 domain-containing protein [Bryobacteraceae bacterium]|nr:DUF1501 domain-containing protein [Bryobacteraceae bacterium]
MFSKGAITRSWLDRREFLAHAGDGLKGIALAVLLNQRDLLAKGQPHFPPKAKRIIQIFCPGAVSHVDTFDYKPELEKRSGQPLPGEEKFVSFQGANGALMKSPWGFRRRGQTGKWISEMLPRLGELADEMAFIHSLTARSNTHGPACVQMNTGFVTEGFPSMGSWVSYGLGTENENLPAYVALPDMRGIPPSGPANWNTGFLPAENQAVVFNASDPIRNLDRPGEISESSEEASRGFLRYLNHTHAGGHPGDTDLAARAASYELAARLQLSAPEVSNLRGESKATRELYGADDPNPLIAGYARNCLLARRLIERGVRFVQLFCGSRASGVDGLLNWDAHKTLKADYERHCPILDGPTAGLIRDLKARGLLADTLVLWTTEFGRMPTHQAGTLGRDHNPDGFTAWMLGAGVKAGVSYGATDDFGRRAAQNISTIYDLHATALHLLGLDHERLTFYHNGIRRRLTDVHGHVLDAILS